MLLENTAAWIVANDDGTGQSGDVWDTEWVRAAAASIDAVLQSATNPAITPAALIDEVVAARGTALTLDARLDVALEEDGTPKAVAGQASNANLQAILQSRNVMLNGNMEDWTLGGALAPDNFVLSGAAATIARTGPAMADTFTFGTGTYAAKVTRAGTDAKLLQTIISAGDMPAAADIKGEKIGILVMGKTAIANHLRIVVDDGVLTTATAYHTGGGTAEALTAVHTISAAATKLEVYAQVNNSNGDAYVGGWTAVFSNLAPTRWLPLDTTPLATISRAGLVGLGDQVLGTGVKTFGAAMKYKPGSDANADATVSGRIHTNTTAVGNVGGGADDLQSYSLPAGVLDTDGKVLRITIDGSTSANANNKTLEYLVGATVITLRPANPDNNTKWQANIVIVRTGAATGIYSAEWKNNVGTNPGIVGTIAETWANAITLKGRGTGTADNDIIQRLHVVEVVG